MYLQNAVKDGSVKHVIEGLSRSGDHYAEAAEECLRERYNRPELIHQTHVRMIIETPSLKDGNGREFCCLHDTVQQHICALKALGHEPSGSSVTSVLELKLDQTTMFEWQKHSMSSTEVPYYRDLLEFLNLRAQASESSAAEGGSKKVPRFATRHPKRDLPPNKAFSSFTAAADLVSAHCILCKPEKHPPLLLC